MAERASMEEDGGASGPEPEAALWKAVLLRMIQDARGNASDGQAGNPEYLQRTAAAWVAGNHADFRMVCWLAGWDPDYVRQRVAKGVGLASRYKRRMRK